MAFSLNRDASTRTSNVSPKAPSPSRPTDPTVPGLSLGLDFPPAKPLPNPDHGAKVIRADPQGRRRHCSETFLASTSSASASSSSSSSTASLFPEHAQAVARRLGFEGMLRGNSNGGVGGGASDPPAQFHLPGPQPSPIAQALCVEQGLNYIDLDLANKETPHPAADGPLGIQAAPSRLFALLGGGSVSGSGGGAGGAGGAGAGGSSLNTYASIDFYKSEELRSHQNGSKEGTEC